MIDWFCRIAYNFVGIRFLSELLPEIAQAISEAKEGEVIEPIQTRLGYHTSSSSIAKRCSRARPTRIASIKLSLA
jgi:hypothetical protein